jgi:signal peptidase I
VIDEHSGEHGRTQSNEQGRAQGDEQPEHAIDEQASQAGGQSQGDGSQADGSQAGGSQADGSQADRQSQADGSQADEQSQAKRRGSFWRELPILLAVAVVVAVVVRAFVLQTFYIPSPSMEHTLDVNDRVLVNKLVYDFRSPHRGEVVVFEAPQIWNRGTEGEDFIKRVIGVGGDRVVCCDAQGRITVNNQPLDEDYLFSQDGVSDAPAEEPFEVTIPEGRLWVMGDHRSASGDSLEHFRGSRDPIESTISTDAVVGRAFVVFWPVNRAKWLSVPDTFDAVPD